MRIQLEVTLVAFAVTIFQLSLAESLSLAEASSDYAKITNSPETTTSRSHSNETTDAIFDYEDFDDLQENRSIDQSPSTDTMMKYFNGIVSILALMYRFNGKFDDFKSQNLHLKKRYRLRKRIREASDFQAIGKRFQEAQDRFEFPQKKFRYQQNAETNSADQQFQPLENYPPYNPLKANAAESYDPDAKKTSYESDLMHYDSEKSNYDQDGVEVQQSYSYEIPYETPKPAKPILDEWKTRVRPIYQPWTSEGPSKEDPTSRPQGGDSYLPWSTHTKTENQPSPQDDYFPWSATSDAQPSAYWKTKIPERIKPVSEPPHPWKGEIPPADTTAPHHPEGPQYELHFDHHEPVPADEDRVSKKPYSYYFLGRKLWYIPLLFSVYFIIYVGALVLKSVARHKIQFPEKIWNLHDDHFGHNSRRRQNRKIEEITEKYEKAIEKSNNKFM